jgi:short-subunit dehydrogenase
MLLAAAAAAGMLVISRLRRYSLTGKVVVVTGGARGFGLVLARALAHKGAKLVICARDEATLRAAHYELSAITEDVLAVPCDVRHRPEVNAMIAAARSTFGTVDVLINNAGTIEVGPLETMTHDDFVASMETHFYGPLVAMTAVVEEMRARRSGRIVNIASIGGLIPLPHLAPYTASKSALVGLSSAFAVELARDGVIVSTICPGLMNTGSPRNARFKGRHHEEYAWFAAGDALPFTTMSPERVARRVVHAIEHGQRFAVVGLEARVAQIFHALFPSLFARVASLVDRALPTGGGIGTAAVVGHESESPASKLLAASAARAAARNNELSYGRSSRG